MNNDKLVQDTDVLIEYLLESENKPNAARRLLIASNIIRAQWELMVLAGDRGEVKRLLSLMERLVIRAGDMLGDTSQEHQWLKELSAEASGMKASFAAAGK
jgi:hypothetical protein